MGGAFAPLIRPSRFLPFDNWTRPEQISDDFTQRSGALAMNDANHRQPGPIRFVEIPLKNRFDFNCPLAPDVDFHRYKGHDRRWRELTLFGPLASRPAQTFQSVDRLARFERPELDIGLTVIDSH